MLENSRSDFASKRRKSS